MQKLLAYQICILTVLYVGYAFYYLTRKSVTFMLPHFSGMNQTGSINLTKNDIGMIISSQNLAYAISKFFGGVLTDVASCRILFGAGLFLSGLLNLGFKKEIKNYQMYYLSFMIGLAQGPAWPCTGKILKAWLPKTQLATWWSVISTAANVAGALGPIVATAIAVKYHWSYGFMIPGCICMSIGYLSIILLRNQPSDIDLPNFIDEEDELFEEDETVARKPAEDENAPSEEADEAEVSAEPEPAEENEPRYLDLIKSLLSYTFFVSICLAYLKVQLIKTLMSDWSQMYLTRTVKVSAYNASYFVSLFEVAGIFGSILSGLLSDYIYFFIAKRRATEPKDPAKPNTITPISIRMTLVRVYFVFLLASLHVFNYQVKDKNASYWLLMSVAASTGFVSYGIISLLGVMAMEFSPSKISGTSHAIAALSANIGAVLAGLPFGVLSKHYTWNGAFKIVEVSTAVVVVFLFLTRNAKSKFETVPVSASKRKVD